MGHQSGLCTCVCACSSVHKRVGLYTCMCGHMYPCGHTRACVLCALCTCVHTCTYVLPCTHMWACTRVGTYTHVGTHMHLCYVHCLHVCTPAHMSFSSVHRPVGMYTCMCGHMYPCGHTRACVLCALCTHVCACTHTCAHVQSKQLWPTQPLPLLSRHPGCVYG